MEAGAEGLILLQHLQDLAQAQRVGPAQETAAERREADAQDQAHVHVARVADNPLGQHAAGLHQHRQEESLGDLLLAKLAPVRADALQDCLEGRVVRAARAQFLFNEPDGGYDRGSSFDLETYNPPVLAAGAAIAGPVALLDPDTALVLHAAKEGPTTQTAVQIAKRVPLGVVKDGMAPRRMVIAAPLGTFIAAAGANGIGYAVANETMPGPNATISIATLSGS